MSPLGTCMKQWWRGNERRSVLSNFSCLFLLCLFLFFYFFVILFRYCCLISPFLVISFFIHCSFFLFSHSCSLIWLYHCSFIFVFYFLVFVSLPVISFFYSCFQFFFSLFHLILSYFVLVTLLFHHLLFHSLIVSFFSFHYFHLLTSLFLLDHFSVFSSISPLRTWQLEININYELKEKKRKIAQWPNHIFLLISLVSFFSPLSLAEQQR